VTDERTADPCDEYTRAERLSDFDLLLENIDDAIVGADAEFRVRLWNAGAERLYGYPASEVLGRSATDIAIFGSDLVRAANEALPTSDRIRIELTGTHRDGTRVEVEVVAVAQRDTAGEIVGYLGVHRDITERKLFEQQQERLVSIVRNSSDFIGISDMQGIPNFVNAAGRKMVGLGERDVTTTHVLEYFAPEDRDFVGAAVLPAIRENGRWPAIVELRLRNWETDATIPVLFDAFRIDDPRTGEPIAVGTVTRDISERKRAEEERAARARQQAAIARLGVQALEDENVATLIDEAIELVASTLDVPHASVGELVDGDEVVVRAGIGWPRAAIGSRGSADRRSFAGYTLLVAESVTSDDVTADDRFTPSPILGNSPSKSGAGVVIPGRDEPYGVLTVFADSVRPFTGDDVDFLQSVANVLAVAIARSRVLHKIGDVREAERRRIARALHDEALQNLFVAIAQAHATPGAEPIATGLTDVSQQLRGTIYDLRLGDAQHRPLSEILGTLVDVHRSMARGYDIDLEIDEDAPDPRLGDTGVEIARIVGEALTNVRRHAGAQRASVRVRRTGGDLCVEVIDDGRGIDRARAMGGSHGLGLTGMHERAALIGADLTVHSEPGSGTTIQLEVPVAGEAAESEDVARVLLVEDHTTVREAMAAAFEREPDLRVAGQASTLAQAREMLPGVDVAVLDLTLPDGFGPDLIRDLQAANHRAQALVLSAALDHAHIARAVDCGACGVLDKTVSLRDVVVAIRRLRAGETLIPREEVLDLVKFARSKRQREREDRRALAELTRRELEVLQLLADGLNTAAIAERLHISPRTQRNHVANILQKLRLHSQLQAVVMALRYDTVKISRGQPGS
jgi:PAS domain S-box-containing protein